VKAVKSIFSAASKTIKDARLFADKEEVLRRQKICGPCPHNDGKKCTECGCIIDVKLAFHGASCNLHKWDVREILTNADYL